MRIPVASTSPQYDLATPRYRGVNPGTYMILAFCYDSLAAPGAHSETNGPFRGVVTPDYTKMMPRLAETFGAERDGSWLLRLRAAVRSHAGNTLSPRDIRWAFEQAFSRQSVAAYRWGQIAGLAGAASVEALDERTIRFRLRAPNPNLMPFLFGGTPPILDSTALLAHATDKDPWGADWISAGHVAGFGPYTPSEITPDRLTFASRPDYWAGESPIGRVVVDRVGSRADAIGALGEREPVYVVGLRPDEVRALQPRDDVFLSQTWAGHTYIGMSYHLPPFDDVRVRHALSYATPYDRIVEEGLLGLARRWRGPVTSFDTWHTDKAWHFDTDQQKARALLHDAGYGQGLGVALYLPMRPDLIRIAEILRRAYAEVGVALELRDVLDVTPGWNPAFVLRTECGHNFNEPVYDIAHDYIPSTPVVPGRSGRVVAETWLSGYASSADFNTQYREVLLAPTAHEREQRAIAMQDAILGFAPFIYLAENLHVNAGNRHVSPWMRDFTSRPVQALSFQNCGTSYIG